MTLHSIRAWFIEREIRKSPEMERIERALSPELRIIVDKRIVHLKKSQDPEQIGAFYQHLRELSQVLVHFDTIERKVPSLEGNIQEQTQRFVEQRITETTSIEEILNIKEDLLTLSALLEYPEILSAFWQATDIRTEDFTKYSEREREWGGLIGYSLRNGILTLVPKQPREGTERTIYVREDLTKGTIGKWHTHHRYFPIPSKEDLSPFNDFNFDVIPHIIGSQNGTRLYIPEPLLDFIQSPLKERFAPYTWETRKREILELRAARSQIGTGFFPLAYLEL